MMYHEENESKRTQKYHCIPRLKNMAIFKCVLIKSREKRQGSLETLKMNESLN